MILDWVLLNPENILIIKLKHLGDVLTTTPVISGIRRAWPKARISYLINPGGEDLVQYHPDVDDVFTVPRTGGLDPQLALIRTLRSRKFDAVFELSGSDRGAFLSWVSGAPVRVGYRSDKEAFLSRRLAFNYYAPVNTPERHTVESHLDALRALGVEPGFQPMSLFYPESSKRRIADFLRDNGLGNGAPYAVVHPSSRWMFKAWTIEGNAAVIDYLEENVGKVVITSAPERIEMDFAGSILEKTGSGPIDLTGRLNLSELAALIDDAVIFFGVDSLPMHMAAALGTPAVALFGPSGEKNWAPWGDGHRVVFKDCDCRPCGRAGCDDSKISKCLVELESSEVISALEDVLGEIR